MLEIAIAFAVGTLFGTGMTCCFVAAGRADSIGILLFQKLFTISSAECYNDINISVKFQHGGIVDNVQF